MKFSIKDFFIFCALLEKSIKAGILPAIGLYSRKFLLKYWEILVRNTSKKNNDIETNTKTEILHTSCLPYSFIFRKFVYSFHKILLKACVFRDDAISGQIFGLISSFLSNVFFPIH